jgi:regulator of sigma E protease
MDMLQPLYSLLSYIVPFLMVLTVVVFFHELGHFWIARRCGVRVLTFSIGFGPELFGFNDKHGTRWRCAAIPLGGYVKFLGDSNAASTPDFDAVAAMTPAEQAVSFINKPLSHRAAIVAAGPVANFILALVVFMFIFMVYGRPVTEARIADVNPASPAAEAGFLPGDIIRKVNGSLVESFSDFQRIISVHGGQQVTVSVERDAHLRDLLATPRLVELDDGFGGKIQVGQLGLKRAVSEEDVKYVRYGLVDASVMSVQETWFIISRTLSYFGGLVTGHESIDQLSGPIRIAQVSGQAASVGPIALVNLVAILSVSIGLLNLFPIPLLDGGHLAFYALEALRGKPMSERAQEIGFRFGLAIVVALMLVVNWNDISRLTSL